MSSRGSSTRQVTLLFPSTLAFRLWCKRMSILRNKEDVDTLHRDGHLLGRYRSAPDTPDGVLAEVAIEAQPAPC